MVLRVIRNVQNEIPLTISTRWKPTLGLFDWYIVFPLKIGYSSRHEIYKKRNIFIFRGGVCQRHKCFRERLNLPRLHQEYLGSIENRAFYFLALFYNLASYFRLGVRGIAISPRNKTIILHPYRYPGVWAMISTRLDDCMTIISTRITATVSILWGVAWTVKATPQNIDLEVKIKGSGVSIRSPRYIITWFW